MREYNFTLVFICSGSITGNVPAREIGVQIPFGAILAFLRFSVGEFAASHLKKAAYDMENNFEIKRVYEHFEVLLNGKFHCSADNFQEAEQEIAEYMRREAHCDSKTGVQTQTN